MDDTTQLLDPDAQLIETAIQRSLVAQTTLDGLLQAQLQEAEQARSQLRGTLFAIDPVERKLCIEDALSGQLLKEIALGGTAAPLAPPNALSLALIEAESLGPAGAQSWQPGPRYGLVVTDEATYLYPPAPLEAERLLASTVCTAPFAEAAFDLHHCPERELLFVVDRSAGSLLIFSTHSHQLLRTVAVRPQGYRRALNLAFDSLNHCLYMTDGQSFMLYVLDLESFELEKIDIGLSGYALGNLAVSPDGERLYLLTLKPTTSLLYLDLENYELLREISLKGELFSVGQNAPSDLLVITPDQAHLLLVTYLDDPEPFTPVVTVIDAHKGKTLQRYALKDQLPPAQLAFPQPNPLRAPQLSPLQLLLQAGVLSAAQLASLQAVDFDADDAPDEGQGAVPALVPQLTTPIDLAPEQALPVLVALLSDRLYQQHEIELLAHPDALARVEAEAERVRHFLEYHDAAEVALTELVGEHGLSAWIARDDLLLRMEQRLRDQAEGLAPPSHCPQCQQSLHDWDCASCGLELESPERKQRRRLCSLTPMAHVGRFQVFLADPMRRRLLLLDPNRTLDWMLEAEALGEIVPWHALWLPNKNLLVLDRENHQLHEIGPSGQLKWTLPQPDQASELNQPVKATYFADDDQELFLIVDQGYHRVVAVDRDGRVHWQYGEQGSAGNGPGQLDLPSDLQWTWTGSCLIADTGNHRVLEVERASGRILNNWGAELGLSGPVFAQRLLNGHTLIVDAGNYRVLELDGDGDIASECFYFKEEMGEAMRMDLPVHAIRGDKQNLLLIDEDKIMELLPGKRRLIWSSLLEHLAHRVDISEDAQGAGENYTRSFYQHKMPSMDDMLERLRARERENPNGLNARLMANFNRLLEVRRTYDSQRAQQVKAKQYRRSGLLDYPIYGIDRTHHYVAQLDRKGQALWHFGGQQTLQRPGQVCADDSSLLIADTGNQRVLEVSLASAEVVLSLGGKLTRLLNQPRSATRTLAGHVLVADQGNRRLVELNRRGEPVWEYKNIAQIASPYFACEQGTGTILFVDWALQMVKEIGRDGSLVWSYGQSRRVGKGPNQLSSPEYAVRLPSGATLIADTHNNRVIEVAPNRKLLWEFGGTPVLPLTHPCYCKRLPDGHTLIAFDNYRQLIEVDEAGSPCWHFEQGNAPLVRV